jgi:hypothetical protein
MPLYEKVNNDNKLEDMTPGGGMEICNDLKPLSGITAGQDISEQV